MGWIEEKSSHRFSAWHELCDDFRRFGFAAQKGLTRAEALQLIRNMKEHGMKSLQ